MPSKPNLAFGPWLGSGKNVAGARVTLALGQTLNHLNILISGFNLPGRFIKKSVIGATKL